MRTASDVPLGPLTTLGVGGPARRLVEVATGDELVDAVRAVDAAGDPLLVLAGGSNVVVADSGFAGVVVRVTSRGMAAARDDDRVRVTVQAGEPWDGVVARCVADGLAGLECLSGIPGSAGGTPIQNVGAYGQEVCETISSVRVYDRDAGAVADLPPSALRFAYRDSALKRDDRRVVVSVTYALRPGGPGAPVHYAELARALGVELEQCAALEPTRTAVLALRRAKGMVLDPGDPDSVSAGSFFMNPILSTAGYARLARRAVARLGPDDRPPRFPAPDGQVKTSAAWLIERAGFGRGYARGRVALSTKHTLALVNRGGASAAEVAALAREIRDGVRDAFGVPLVAEPRFVGWSPGPGV